MAKVINPAVQITGLSVSGAVDETGTWNTSVDLTGTIPSNASAVLLYIEMGVGNLWYGYRDPSNTTARSRLQTDGVAVDIEENVGLQRQVAVQKPTPVSGLQGGNFLIVQVFVSYIAFEKIRQTRKCRRTFNGGKVYGGVNERAYWRFHDGGRGWFGIFSHISARFSNIWGGFSNTVWRFCFGLYYLWSTYG